MKVLVIEDSARLRQTLRLALRKHGYVVDGTGDGQEGLWMAQSGRYDVLILDLMLPKLDGITIVRRLREQGAPLPILILTVKGSVEERVAGLEAGADDYMAKPFALKELVARVDVLIRRKYERRSPLLVVGDLEMNTAARTVTRQGRPVELTPREYRLLELLMLHPSQVVTHEEMEAHLYSESAEIFSNVIQATMSNLRKKLDSPGKTSVVQTRRGIGYVLAPAAE